jgi:hypothetical protein
MLQRRTFLVIFLLFLSIYPYIVRADENRKQEKEREKTIVDNRMMI